MRTIRLNNGVEIPILGFGTFQITGTDAEQAVMEAIKAGYRHIDTAQSYMNEEAVGKGVSKSGVPCVLQELSTQYCKEKVHTFAPEIFL